MDFVLWAIIFLTLSTYESLSLADEVHWKTKRVIGGEDVTGDEFPWLASLQGKVPDKMFLGFGISHYNFYCGASIISSRWILTAAHCFPVDHPKVGSKALVPKYWHVRIGELELRRGWTERIKDNVAKVFGKTDFRHYFLHAEKIFIHPEYDSANFWMNDIALIKLEEEVPLSELDNDYDDDDRLIQAVGLASSDSFPEDDTLCVMKGWGCTANGGAVTSQAKQIAIPKMNDWDCKKLWAVDTETRVCAGRFGRSFNQGICSGDSGGPLVCPNENGKWIQIGIASFTSADHPESVPGVFTRVSHYKDWIRDVVENE